MCFGSISSVLEWLERLENIYQNVYSGKNNGTSGTYYRFAISAKQNGLQILKLTEDEKNTFCVFLQKVKSISSEYEKMYGRTICVNNHLFLHLCFPEKNIFCNYYKPPGSKLKDYDTIGERIKNLLQNE